MTQTLSEPVSVQLTFNHSKKLSEPRKIFWQNRLYPITKVGLHHTFREGRTLFHIFSVTSNNLFFRLRLDSENLFWTLEEISDGLPS
jgi:hypothetical protein